MFLSGDGNGLEAGAPAAFAHFIGIDEIVGFLTALVTFQHYRPRHAANSQPARERLPLDPLGKQDGHVAVEILTRFFG